MNNKVIASLGLALAIVVVVIGSVYAQGGSEPVSQEPPAQKAPGVLTAGDVVSPTFSYQGVLKEGGEPVTGSREMTFRLYSDAGCLDLVGTPHVYTVPVNEGVFHVALEVSQGDVDGQALWLETEVGGLSVGCQPVQAVPYALGLRPGAVVSGTLPAQQAVTFVNGSSSIAAVRGLAAGGSAGDVHPDGAYYPAGGEFSGMNGVIGAVPDGIAAGYGVLGLTPGTSGRGVYGYASSKEGVNFGVEGRSESSSGYGVYGLAASGTGKSYGVLGRTLSTGGYGVYGLASEASGNTYGVYGQTNSYAGTGGYFTNAGSNLGLDLVAGSGGGGTDGRISSDPGAASSDLHLTANDDVRVYLDDDRDENSSFSIYGRNLAEFFRIDETGDVKLYLENDGAGVTVYDNVPSEILSMNSNGDVSQPRTAGGLVKAAAVVACRDYNAAVSRFFNNVVPTISVTEGSGDGRCIIDFGFRVGDRFWSAEAWSSADVSVSCAPLEYGSTEMECFRHTSAGVGNNGTIVVTVY